VRKTVLRLLDLASQARGRLVVLAVLDQGRVAKIGAHDEPIARGATTAGTTEGSRQ
jgi:hypothetical protein